MHAIIFLGLVLAIYAVAYFLYGRELLERRVVKADPNRPTPAVEKFDGIDYVPANKYVLYGHHFASIAGAGPIIGPALALAWGWFLPLLWVLFGNIFIGAVHDYTSMMASVRQGGLSIMSISEGVMGRRARYIFLVYVWAALILVLAAFISVASTTFESVPTAATLAIVFMPLSLLFGIMVYKFGIDVRIATIVTLVLVFLGLLYSFRVPVHLSYEGWVVVLALYSILAAALPVWYLLQPRDYLNAYVLWIFVGLALVAPLFLPFMEITGPAITSFVAKGAVIGAPRGTPAAGMDIAYFWPMVPLTIACGALSGFHSVVASGTTSKQLANELDALLVGYGGMLTEGAVSSLAVILPAALFWDFAAAAQKAGIPLETLKAAGIDVEKTKNILAFGAADRFYNAYALAQATAWSKLFGLDFVGLFKGFKTFAAWALTAFVLTTLDTANRLARFAWTELMDWLRPVNRSAYRVITNRFVASIIPIALASVLAYPTVEGVGRAYLVIWPAFAGTNQLLAALALLTATLWVYAVLRVRGPVSLLMLIPAAFLWITVTLALALWVLLILPNVPFLYQIGAGSLVVLTLGLDLLLIYLFVRGLLKARSI
ncbi:MAG: carbon starvation protein A [Acidilobaceae archaeon]|nr:carbon starvation protein A [Acidilobaceae archaeon]